MVCADESIFFTYPVICLQISLLVFKKMHICVTTKSELSSKPCQQERVWQSHRLDLLKCEGKLCQTHLLGHVEIICTNIYVQFSDLKFSF